MIEIARDNGFEVELYTSNTEGFLTGLSGVTYHSNYYRRSETRILTLFSFFLSQFLLFIWTIYSHRSSQSIFYVNTVLPFGSILAGRILGKKVITHVHEFEISPKALSNFLFAVVRKYSSEIVLVSNFMKSNTNFKSTKNRVIYNCVTSDFEKKVMLNPKKNLDFIVLMLASLRPYKGIYNFLELANRIPEAGFVLILSDKSEEVMKFESENSIPVNLKILPIQKDVHLFYRAASLLLNLTQKDKIVETFGLTVLEGMYYGLPAIVPTVGGITELVDSGKNGFQLDYTQQELIEKEIRKMMKDHIHYKNLSQKALLKKDDFSRKTFETQILELLGK